MNFYKRRLVLPEWIFYYGSIFTKSNFSDSHLVDLSFLGTIGFLCQCLVINTFCFVQYSCCQFYFGLVILTQTVRYKCPTTWSICGGQVRVRCRQDQIWVKHGEQWSLAMIRTVEKGGMQRPRVKLKARGFPKPSSQPVSHARDPAVASRPWQALGMWWRGRS